MAGRSRSRGRGVSCSGRGRGNVSFRRELSHSMEVEHPTRDEQQNQQEQEQDQDQDQDQEQDQEQDEEIRTLSTTDKESLPTLSPDQFWFGRRCVSNAVGESIRHYYRSPYMNWSETPESVRDRWFNNFRNFFKWEKEFDRRVRDGYDEYAAKRLKGIVSHAGKQIETNGKKPKWINEIAYAQLKIKRQEPAFKERSKRASTNKKASAEDGVIPLTHHMGSISALETALKMTKANKGKLPAAPELFFHTHSVVVDATTGKRELKSKKDKEVYATYNEKLNEAVENEDEELENGDRENEDEENQAGENQVAENVKKDAVFLKAVGGRKKGQVYGLGCADELYYKKTSRNKRTSSMAATSYCPGVVRQLEERVQQSENAREQLEKANEEIKKTRENDRLLFEQRLEAQREEMMKRMDERFQLMQQQHSCHNNITPRPNPDEDSFGGNGGATMQVG